MKRFDQIISDSNQLFKRIAKIKHDVVNDHDVKQFLEQHQAELTNAMIDEDLNVPRI